jgi:hypothetical protein
MQNPASMLVPDVRFDVMCVEIVDVGQRMRVFSPKERGELLYKLWMANHFCWGCYRDYAIPATKTCPQCEGK